MKKCFTIFSVYMISISKFCVLFMEASWTFCEISWVRSFVQITNRYRIRVYQFHNELNKSPAANSDGSTCIPKNKQLLWGGEQKLFCRTHFLEEGNFKLWFRVFGKFFYCSCTAGKWYTSFLDDAIIGNRLEHPVPFSWKVREESLRKANGNPTFS